MKYALFGVCFCLLSAPLGAVGARTVLPVLDEAEQNAPSEDTRRAEIAARFGAVTSIESRFTQEKHMALLDAPVTSEGFFYFQKPGRIRWQYEKPFQNGFLIKDGKTFRLEKGKKEEQKNPMAQNVAAQLLTWLTFDLPALSKQYAVEFTPDGVTLTPLADGLVKRIAVTFDPQNPQALSRVEMDEAGRDKTVLIFLSPKTNVPLPPGAFE